MGCRGLWLWDPALPHWPCPAFPAPMHERQHQLEGGLPKNKRGGGPAVSSLHPGRGQPGTADSAGLCTPALVCLRCRPDAQGQLTSSSTGTCRDPSNEQSGYREKRK